jgi:hypothetical protein
MPALQPAPVCRSCGDVHTTKGCQTKENTRDRLPTIVARVSPDLKARVRAVCERVGATEAEYVRMLVEEDIMKQERYLECG